MNPTDNGEIKIIKYLCTERRHPRTAMRASKEGNTCGRNVLGDGKYLYCTSGEANHQVKKCIPTFTLVPCTLVYSRFHSHLLIPLTLVRKVKNENIIIKIF